MFEKNGELERNGTELVTDAFAFENSEAKYYSHFPPCCRIIHRFH